MATYDQEVIADAPEHYYRFNDASGTVAVDAMGVTNGTYSSSYTLAQTGFVAGGSSVDFSAVNTGGKVNCNFSNNYTTACTAEFWFNASSTGQDAVPYLVGHLQFYAAGTSVFPFAVKWDPAAKTVYFVLSKGNDFTADLILTSATLAADTDYHCVAVYRASGLCEIYINGALSASSTINFTISSPSPGLDWTIATPSELTGGVGNGTFNGRMAEVAIYSTALSSTRILAHYEAAASAPIDSTGALAGPGSAVVGSAAAAEIRPSSGVLVGPGAAITSVVGSIPYPSIHVGYAYPVLNKSTVPAYDNTLIVPAYNNTSTIRG